MEAIFSGTRRSSTGSSRSIGFSGVTQGINFVRLKDWDERPLKQQDITKSLFPKLFAIPGLLAFASNPPSLGQSPIDKPIQYVLQTSQPYDVLQGAVDQMLAGARQNPQLQNLDSDLKLNKPQLRVTIDREKAALLGIDVETIGRTVETMLGGRQVTRSSATASNTTSWSSSRTSIAPIRTICARFRAWPGRQHGGPGESGDHRRDGST